MLEHVYRFRTCSHMRVHFRTCSITSTCFSYMCYHVHMVWHIFIFSKHVHQFPNMFKRAHTCLKYVLTLSHMLTRVHTCSHIRFACVHIDSRISHMFTCVYYFVNICSHSFTHVCISSRMFAHLLHVFTQFHIGWYVFVHVFKYTHTCLLISDIVSHLFNICNIV